MAWAFSNWCVQTTLSTKVVTLRQHVQEIADTIQARITADGTTFDPGPLQAYHATMLKQLMDLELSLSRSPRCTRGRLAPGGVPTPLLYQGFTR